MYGATSSLVNRVWDQHGQDIEVISSKRHLWSGEVSFDHRGAVYYDGNFIYRRYFFVLCPPSSSQCYGDRESINNGNVDIINSTYLVDQLTLYHNDSISL